MTPCTTCRGDGVIRVECGTGSRRVTCRCRRGDPIAPPPPTERELEQAGQYTLAEK